MTRYLIAGSIVGLMWAAAPAAGQVSSVPRHIGHERFAYPEGENPIDKLNQLRKSGNWQALQVHARQLLAALSSDEKVGRLLGDTATNYYNLVWQTEGDDGKPAVARVLVSARLRGEHSARIPGIGASWETISAESVASTTSEPAKEPILDKRGPELLDVLLSDADSASLSSSYVFTPTADPLISQLPDVVSRLGILGFLAKADGTTSAESESILVYVNQPNMVMTRAKIQIRDVISVRLSAASLVREADKTYQSVRLRQARSSPCALSLAAGLRAALTAAAKTPACAGVTAECSPALKKAVDVTFEAIVPKCAAEPPGGAGFDPVVATEQEFRKLVTAGGAKTTVGDSVLTNLPRTRLGFGILAGMLVGHPSLEEDRVKVDGGKIVKAPFDRNLSMVVLNFHPKGYDSEWPRMSMAERLRLFVGGVLTPDFGVSAGIGVGLVRGLSVNIGAAWLLSETLKPGETLGEPPLNSNDPFKTKVATTGFVGFSYAFK